MNDEYIIRTFFNSSGRLNGNHSTEEWLKANAPRIYDYLIHRFDDSESLRETFLRIWNKIEHRPLCPICGKPRTYRGKKDHLYNDTCGKGTCYCKLREQVTIKRYGISNFGGTPESVKKIQQTKKERYGDPGYHNVDKMKSTNMKLYGGTGTASKQILEKVQKTCKERHGGMGGASDSILRKMKQTCLVRYGTDNYRKTKECVEKIYNTKKQNGTVNTSKVEERIYIILCNLFGKSDIIRQYVDARYKNPMNDRFFHCDFYISSRDIFIEIQGYWGHGKHPFDPTSAEDIQTVNEWKSKTKKCYSTAIEKWTVSDPLKRKVASENHLHYIEIFDTNINENDLIKLLESC